VSQARISLIQRESRNLMMGQSRILLKYKTLLMASSQFSHFDVAF
jgi:hypothetical protein